MKGLRIVRSARRRVYDIVKRKRIRSKGRGNVVWSVEGLALLSF
jgi:hypothetical protein